MGCDDGSTKESAGRSKPPVLSERAVRACRCSAGASHGHDLVLVLELRLEPPLRPPPLLPRDGPVVSLRRRARLPAERVVLVLEGAGVGPGRAGPAGPGELLILPGNARPHQPAPHNLLQRRRRFVQVASRLPRLVRLLRLRLAQLEHAPGRELLAQLTDGLPPLAFWGRERLARPRGFRLRRHSPVRRGVATWCLCPSSHAAHARWVAAPGRERSKRAAKTAERAPRPRLLRAVHRRESFTHVWGAKNPVPGCQAAVGAAKGLPLPTAGDASRCQREHILLASANQRLDHTHASEAALGHADVGSPAKGLDTAAGMPTPLPPRYPPQALAL